MSVHRKTLAALTITAALTACGSGGPGDASTLGGSVLGLAASGLVLEVNQKGDLAVPADATEFSLGVFAEGDEYDVRVKTQPSGQTCSVYNGQGKMAASTCRSIVVYCSGEVHRIGGTVDGLLAGETLTLALNGVPYALTSNGTFWFVDTIPTQAKYRATFVSATRSACQVRSGEGTMGHDDVAGVEVVCSLCGNGRPDSGETCDDGNRIGGDGCSADCKSDETCGNGVWDKAAREACDPTAIDSPHCTAECRMTGCGNEVIDDGEQCDLGMDENGVSRNTAESSCTPECQTNVCGDGYRRDGAEDCDTGPSCNQLHDTCAYGERSCTLCSSCHTVSGRTSYCGDGTTDSAHGEECDTKTTTDPTRCPAGQSTCKVCSTQCRWLYLTGS